MYRSNYKGQDLSLTLHTPAELYECFESLGVMSLVYPLGQRHKGQFIIQKLL